MRIFALIFFLLLSPLSAEQLADGFYSVVHTESPSKQTELSADNHARTHYNPIFLENDDPELSVVVRTDDFVPILLKESPTKTADTTERTQFWLHVSLADSAAKQFEDFTREHLNGSVAVVVGGQVVTMHKIKAVITGGKIQISRCGDNGCQVLFKELSDNLAE